MKYIVILGDGMADNPLMPSAENRRLPARKRL